jgi:ribonuclease BN (tRNA processing enzyme)
MKMTVIGCGDAFSSGGRRNTSFLIESKGQKILMDFGATSLYGLNSLGITASDIDVVFISHFHGDHFGGIPFLIINRAYNQEESKELIIVGPKGLKDRVRELQRSMYSGTEGLLDNPNLSFVEFDTGQTQDIQGIKLWTTNVIHSPSSEPHGYKIEIDKKIVAYSGDTEWTENLYAIADQTDLFICECNDLHGDVAGHLSYDTLSPHLSKFNTKKTVLTHMGNDMLNSGLSENLLQDGMAIEV